MTDKLRSTYPIAVEFTDGELPSAAKLNAMSNQAKNGLNVVETAVGDLWNQAGDNLLSSAVDPNEYALMIPNLARALGAQDLNNSHIPNLSAITRYTWSAVHDDYILNNQAFLDFPPTTTCSTWNWSGTAPLPAGNPKATPGAVVASGDWYVDLQTGRMVFYDAILADWTLEYEPRVNGNLGDGASFNVIPDPDTDVAYAFQGCKIEYVNGVDNSSGYYIYLPPRGPLYNRRFRRSPADVAANYDSTPTVGEYYFWQDDTVEATVTSGYAAHYRYNLPAHITDNWSAAARIGDGLIKLWDPAGTATVIDGVTCRAENAGTPRTWMFVASGDGLETYLASAAGQLLYPTANLQNTAHTAALYPSSGLRVIVTGCSVQESLAQLWRHFLQHDHSSDYDQNQSDRYLPTGPVDHGDLHNCYYRDDVVSGGEPFFHPSVLLNDWHPQYLHRKGLDAQYLGDDRDRFKNGMLGDLFMCSSDSSSDYDNVVGDSNALRFGESTTSGPKVYYSQAEGGLKIENTPTFVETVKAAQYNDLVYGYGISGGAESYGPIRTHQMYPQDFTLIVNSGSAPFSKVSTAKLSTYDSDEAFGLYLDRQNGGVNPILVMGKICLPFARYVIVGMMMKMGSIGHTFSAGELMAGIGYYAGPGGTGSPTGTIATNSGSMYDIHDSTGDIAAGNWDAQRLIFDAGSSAPFITVRNNRAASGYLNKPYVLFTYAGGNVGEDVVISDITIEYRIVEY